MDSKGSAMRTERFGFVVLLGRPNAGKSTLLNACVGTKISAVCAKPQTTRNRILGVTQVDEVQLAFTDTPGLHRATNRTLMNKLMNQTAWGTLEDADLVCYLVDLTRGWSSEDEGYFQGVRDRLSAKPLWVVGTKGDRIPQGKARERLEELRGVLGDSLRLCSVSAKRPEEVSSWKRQVAEAMPQGPWCFPNGECTDQPLAMHVGELIREQVVRALEQELPYQIAVRVESLEDTAQLVRVSAAVLVEKSSQKGIVIGKGGSTLKAIGTRARISLEALWGKKVYLELFVKTVPGWMNSPRALDELAHIKPGG